MNPNIMNDLLSGRIMNLPAPVIFVLATLAGTTTLGATYFAMGNSPGRTTALIIVAVGLVLVVLLFLAFRALVKWRAKRKANPLAQGIAGNAAAAPQGISEPARRARLDDLRRNFEQGVEKFRAAGKNLYSVPWYVLVGEPGSGKTEAIRHCNVGFPPGLQDQLQGAGGTLNMNWWFTNAAIILDTAGRMMFEEVAPGSTNEWNEFLKLLKQNRPNSPLNGMLLVIPVDTLIKDSADAIEKKATRIAQQFDQIQRILGVRFPVFVIITKCDLLNGFREFFDDLNDPQLQHQIMGWSNPAPLDERFDPAKVTAHLETVKQRLMARRQNLLLDPVNTEDPQARRVDQVDALYTLPDSVTKIGPRLRRYLEMIFVAGEWSPKPLFLRGIYFTSSMTEGAALDAELAEALGVPVDSLPGGAIFRKDRAYFLRDLFLEKVFREKGLVTRASNADKQQRSRRMMVMGFLFIAVIVLFTVTWFGSRSLERSLGAERDFWMSAASLKSLEQIAIVDGESYSEKTITVAGARTSLPDLFANNLERVKKDLDIPLIFKPMTVFSTSVNTQRRTAYRSLYEVTVLRPMYMAARARIMTLNFEKAAAPAMVPGTASAPATAGVASAEAASFEPTKAALAVAELMKLEYVKVTGKTPPGADAAHPQLHPQVDLAALMGVTLAEEDYRKFSKDSDNLQKVADWIYSDPESKWPPAVVDASSKGSLEAIDHGVQALLDYWNKQSADDSETMKKITAVQSAFKSFEDAEAALLKLRETPMAKTSDYDKFRKEWQGQYALVMKARANATQAWNVASGGKDNAKLVDIYSAEKDATLTNALKNYEVLLRYTLDGPVEANNTNPAYKSLMQNREAVRTAQSKLKDWKASTQAATTLKNLARLDAEFLAMIKDTDLAMKHRFDVQGHLYDMANAALVKEGEGASLTGTMTIAEAFKKIESDTAKATADAGSLKIQASGDKDLLLQAIGLAQFMTDSSIRERKALLIREVLKIYPVEANADAAKWSEAVAKLAKNVGRENIVRPPVPLVTFATDIFDEQYSLEVAGTMVNRLGDLDKALGDTETTTKMLDFEEIKGRVSGLRTSFEAYKKAYVAYWSETVKKELDFSIKYKDYKGFTERLGDTSEAAITKLLTDYGDRMALALKNIGAVDEANAVKATALQVIPDEWKAAFKSWRDLTADAVAARRSILGMSANDFKDGFTVSSANTNKSYVGIYWNSLPVAGLSAMVADGEKQITQGMAKLETFERFPLAPMDDKKPDLTIEEVIAARKALEQIRGSVGTATTAGVAGSAGAKPIGQGGSTNNALVNEQLDRLRGTKLLGAKAAYYAQLDKFLPLLPTEDSRIFSVTLAIDKAKQVPDVTPDTISNIYPYMRVLLGDNQVKEFSINVVNDESCKVDYDAKDQKPGALKLSFRKIDGPVVQTETFAGPWAALRLLKSEKVAPGSLTLKDGKCLLKYTVTTPAPESKKTALYLTLEFKQGILDPKDWPDPNKKP